MSSAVMYPMSLRPEQVGRIALTAREPEPIVEPSTSAEPAVGRPGPRTLEKPAMFGSVRSESLSPGWVVVAISGEIDLEEKDLLTAEIVAAAEPGVSMVVVDLSAVTFLGSSGVHGLVRAWQALSPRGVGVQIGTASPIVERVLQVTGVRQRLEQVAGLPEETAPD
jgi:anti-sigma B factor antagonist